MINKNVLTIGLTSFLITILLWAPLASGQVWANGQHADGSHAHHHHFMENLLPSSYHHSSVDDFHYNQYTNSLAPAIAQSILPMLIVAQLHGPLNYFEISPGDMPLTSNKLLLAVFMLVGAFYSTLRPQHLPIPDLTPPK